MGASEQQAGDIFVAKLALLNPKNRAAIHDRINSLLAERPPASPKTGPVPEQRKLPQGITTRERQK
jgi:hypothetical protein